jgi:hypothetical protein
VPPGRDDDCDAAKLERQSFVFKIISAIATTPQVGVCEAAAGKIGNGEVSDYILPMPIPNSITPVIA